MTTPTFRRRITRRRIVQLIGVGAAGLAGLLAGCATMLRPGTRDRPFPELSCAPTAAEEGFDYVIVGSGAGGGPLAARLALAGFRVLVLEAGGDDEPYNYQVPAFHPKASEDERLAWNFFVRHYQDEARQARDEKFRPDRDGVLYPRASTVGGCTAHNAMILVYPHNSDWEFIAESTGDESWRPDNMRRYFERLERCEYASSFEIGTRHGFSGWLATNLADPALMVRDRFLKALVRAAVKESAATLDSTLTGLLLKLRGDLDPNDWRLVKRSVEGVCVTPLSTDGGRRIGSREFLREAQSACGGNLVIRTHALVSRVLLDENNRATGVEFFSGPSLYRADPRSGGRGTLEPMRVSARREVILCGGAFNTPQILKLSGIGPRDELQKHGIPLRVELPGVGENLQDRYEVAVVTRMNGDFTSMKGMSYRAPEAGEEPDPQFRQWLRGEGPYTTNGAVVSIINRSYPERSEPDLFIFGLLGRFEGYYPGYSDYIAQRKDFFTWAILKAHSNNTAGRVTLRSADPTDVPAINFHYFDEGTDFDSDLESVVAGVDLVRRIVARAKDIVAEEVVPGPEVQTREQIREFIRDNAWGHHASCSCKMGPATDSMAVVDSNFRVHGAKNLRIVDASVFPKIPGFFIVSSVYMISEKASDVIIADARSGSDAARSA